MKQVVKALAAGLRLLLSGFHTTHANSDLLLAATLKTSRNLWI